MAHKMLKHLVLMTLCSFFGMGFTQIINKVFKESIVFHKDYCAKTGRCIKCGRHICRGCNTTMQTAGHFEYGYCLVCSYGGNVYNNIVLQRKPFIKPKNIKQYYKCCGNDDAITTLYGIEP